MRPLSSRGASSALALPAQPLLRPVRPADDLRFVPRSTFWRPSPQAPAWSSASSLVKLAIEFLEPNSPMIVVRLCKPPVAALIEIVAPFTCSGAPSLCDPSGRTFGNRPSEGVRSGRFRSSRVARS